MRDIRLFYFYKFYSNISNGNHFIKSIFDVIIIIIIIIIIRLGMSPVTGISSWYFSWVSGDPHRSDLKLHIAVLSVLCVMFQV